MLETALTKDLCGGAETKELKDEDSTKGSRPAAAAGGPQHYDIDMSPPPKDRRAQPEAELGRKQPRVPPAELLSLQGRTGAPRSFSGTTSYRRIARALHLWGSPRKSLFLSVRRHCWPYGIHTARGETGATRITAHRARLVSSQGERVPCPFPTPIPIVILIVHGSGARLIHCGNETRLRRSNGLSLKRTTRS